MTDWSYLGLCAGFLTTLAFLPQVIRTWRTRSTEDISLVTYATFSLGVLLWLLYGLAQGDIAITIANAITLALALTILVLKIRYG